MATPAKPLSREEQFDALARLIGCIRVLEGDLKESRVQITSVSVEQEQVFPLDALSMGGLEMRVNWKVPYKEEQ